MRRRSNILMMRASNFKGENTRCSSGKRLILLSFLVLSVIRLKIDEGDSSSCLFFFMMSDALVIHRTILQRQRNDIIQRRSMKQERRNSFEQRSRKATTISTVTSSSLFSSTASNSETKLREGEEDEDALSSKKSPVSIMMKHRLLTPEEELELGGYIQDANEVQSALHDLLMSLKKKRGEEAERLMIENELRYLNDDIIPDDVLYAENSFNSMKADLGRMANLEDELDDDLHNLSVYSGNSFDNLYSQDDDEFEIEDGFQIESYAAAESEEEKELRLHHMDNQRTMRMKGALESDNVNLLDVLDQLDSLSEEEILNVITLPRIKALKNKQGKNGEIHAEIKRVILRGALAKDELIRCNIKFVVSIARRWAGTDASSGAFNAKALSIDEAVQEGIMGLAQAAERFDPKRKLRFITYAAYYITNRIRISSRNASVGSLKIPTYYHDVFARYKKVVENEGEEPDDVSIADKEAEIAEKVGVTVAVLRKVIRYTKPLASLDARVKMSENSNSFSALGDFLPSTASIYGAAGGSYYDTMTPMESLDLSLLRQCLENAMATQLSPHERDVIRLRLGLDDGVTRTCREVAAVCGSSQTEIFNVEKRAYSKLNSPFGIYTSQLISFADLVGIDITTATTI